MVQITKIENVSSNNFEIDSARLNNPASVIRYIVIGMTNDLHSGYAYANMYKNPLPAPRFSFNYVIDKNGNVYQTIEDKFVPFTVKSSDADNRSQNVDVLSICVKPTWDGEGYGDDYDRGSMFPQDADTDDYFILTKARVIEGEDYPIGLYKYDGVDWVLEEELSELDVKRPYNSENWSFEAIQEDRLVELVKWLQSKYGIPDVRVLRVFDFYKMWSPAPYVNDEGYQWVGFKDRLVNEDLDEHFVIIPEKSISISGEISEANPTMTTEELIEMYGPETKAKAERFKGNAIVDVDKLPPTDFQIEIGIHNQKDTLWHITECVSKCDWTTYIDGSVGTFDFTLDNREHKIDVAEGYNVGYWIDKGVAGLKGNINEINEQLKDKGILNIGCLSFMRYLQNKGWANYENKTASQIFAEICTFLNLPHRVVDESTYICKGKNYFADGWYKPIEDAIIDTLANTGEYYILQDNFGVIEFRNIKNSDNIKNIIFDEESCIIDGSFNSNITNSYNYLIGYIKGQKTEDGSVAVAEVAGAKDESTIQQWGMLTEVEEVPEGNVASLQDYVNKRLKFYNSPRRTFNLQCIGVPGIIAGNIIWLEIKDVASVGNVAGFVIVDKCTHHIEEGKHTMDLDVSIVQEGTLQFDLLKALQKIREEGLDG